MFSKESKSPRYTQQTNRSYTLLVFLFSPRSSQVPFCMYFDYSARMGPFFRRRLTIFPANTLPIRSRGRAPPRIRGCRAAPTSPTCMLLMRVDPHYSVLLTAIKKFLTGTPRLAVRSFVLPQLPCRWRRAGSVRAWCSVCCVC